MLPIQESDILNTLSTIEWSEPEQASLLKSLHFDDSSIYYIHYKNRRVWHEYQINIFKRGENIEVFSYIKHPDTGKNISRTPRTTEVTDKILFALITHIREEVGLNAYPDFFEIKRFMKHLSGGSLCSPFVSEYVSKYIAPLVQID